MKNSIQDLRNHLFGILEELNDKEVKNIDKERVKLSVDVSQTIINSAKVEVEYAKAIGGTKGTESFFQQKQLQ